ncbi:MAG: discoidin domain-containing protein [Lachnospiraceae bacterium]|nr:discoidin domain-containing protein [Lachnospiraceae bacterium]
MNRRITIILAVITVLALGSGIAAYFLMPEAKDPGVTLVTAPKQEKAQRPACFPDPEANYIKMPEGENLALNKEVTSGEITDVYVTTNVNDGKTDTYWESKGFPAEMTIDLKESKKISTVAVRLNPSAVWEARSQEIAVKVSSNGTDFKEVAAAAMYEFNPDTGNRIRIDFDPTEAVFVKVIISKNTSSRTGGAQAAEIEIYE